MIRRALVVVLLLDVALMVRLFWPVSDGFHSYLGVPISTEAFDQHVREQMERRGVPGLSVAVIDDAEIVYHQTFGQADVARSLPVTSRTIFEGASTSKPMFAFFVMRLVDAGKLDLDRPLHEYLPHADLIDDPRHRDITARMVLSHRTGLPNWRESEVDEKLTFRFDPGAGYLYSGEAYQYLAEVLCAIEGTDWAGLEALFQEQVARPLGLQHTVYVQTPFTRANRAEPYDTDGEWIDWQKDPWYIKGDGVFVAPASLHTEALDFSRWLQALMRRDLLTPESYAELFTPHSSVPSDAIELSYTLGFHKIEIPLTDLYMHTGNNVGFDAWFALDIEDHWGFATFTNSDNGEGLGEEMFGFLLLGPHVAIPLAIVALGALTVLLLIAEGIRMWRTRARS
ncbi:MAG: beta-lactamase family protein [Myxococcales bacterium]|nr:beta-lactamase family protein [Myxococcales bacterium]